MIIVHAKTYRKEIDMSITDIPWVHIEELEKITRAEPAPPVKKVIQNDDVTVVIWGDGTKSRATCSEADQYDGEIGFAICLMKKLYGKKRLARILRRATIVQRKELAP
jgi:hypothetical protein